MNNNDVVLVTGGSGFIGKEVCRLLVEAGHEVINIDRVKKAIDGVTQYPFDLSNHQTAGVLKVIRPKTIIHLAADHEVARSMEDPGTYYWNNVANTISLLNSAVEVGVENFVFSSSSSVYGNKANGLAFTEEDDLNPISPYAKSKKIIEEILVDYNTAHGLNYASLRYFNAAGAGYTQVPPTHLIPNIAKHIVKGTELEIYGKDYTNHPSGTAVRDYTHVTDIAEAHLCAMDFLNINKDSNIFNIGAGQGYSVMEVIKEFENVSGIMAKPVFKSKRAGDVNYTLADNSKSKNTLGWHPTRTLTDIVTDALEWEKKHK